MATGKLLQKENSTVHKEVLDANGAYVKSFGDKGKLPLPPGRKFAILTCMDARLDPAKYAGLDQLELNLLQRAAVELLGDLDLQTQPAGDVAQEHIHHFFARRPVDRAIIRLSVPAQRRAARRAVFGGQRVVRGW